jgi:Spy/CpxP family protein refolding chaperone
VIDVIGKRTLIYTAAALLLTAGLVFTQAPGPGNPGSPAGWLANRLDRVATVLSLTDDQKAQVKTIFDNALGQSKSLFPQMRQNRQAIEQLVKSGTTGAAFDTQLQTLASTQASLASQRTVIYAKALAQVWNLLTPAQQEKAAQLHDLLRPGRGGMMGRGMAGAHTHHGPQ